MYNFYRLDQIQPQDQEQVGEYGVRMGQLAQAGYPVMPSLVVPVETFQAFLHHINWLEPLFSDLPESSLHLDVDNPCQLQTIARQIRSEMLAATLPESLLLAIMAEVRLWQTSALLLKPSVIVQGNTKLSLGTTELLQPQVCWVETTAIAQGLQATWGELFRAKSLLYWQRAGMQLSQMGMVVTIQPLHPTISSGTAYRIDQQLMIQAFPGIALASNSSILVSDTYHVQYATGESLAQAVGKKLICCIPVSAQSTTGDQIEQVGYILPANTHAALCCRVLPAYEQQAPVLDQAKLQALTTLVSQVHACVGDRVRLDWSLESVANDGSWQFVISSIHPVSGVSSLSPAEPAVPSSALHPVLVTGVAASPGKGIGAVYLVDPNQPKPKDLPPETTLVATSLCPDWLPLLKNVTGIVTEQGGLTSHAAILARELGIPAIVSASGASEYLHSGIVVVVDGDRGCVYLKETVANHQKPVEPSSLLHSQSKQHSPSLTNNPQPSTHHLAPSAPHAISTIQPPQLLVNLSQLHSLQQATDLAVSGVGLLRSELLALDVLDYQHPRSWLDSHRQQEFVDRMAAAITRIAAAFFPRPVWYRSLDLRSHEFRTLPGGEQVPLETNPMLGMRGTLSYVKHPDLFRLELAALAHVQRQGYTNLHLLLPFVRTVEEFVFCRQQAIAAGLTANGTLQLWIMAEVPSVLWLLPAYVEAGVQGISIGTNDLTQLVLAVDRDDMELGSGYDANHLAMMGAIAQLIHEARRLQIPCSICGQAPVQYPEIISSLVQWGITSISVEPMAVEQTRRALQNAAQHLQHSLV